MKKEVLFYFVIALIFALLFAIIFVTSYDLTF